MKSEASDDDMNALKFLDPQNYLIRNYNNQWAASTIAFW